MTIHALLDNSMTHEPDSLSSSGDWNDIQERIVRRSSRRRAVQRGVVAGFIVLMGLALIDQWTMTGVESEDLPVPTDTTSTQLDRWPGSNEIIRTSEGVRSSTSTWLIRTLAFGLPSAAAWVLWFCAPDYLRRKRPVERVGRLTIAIAAAILCSLAIGTLTLIHQGFFYDPMSASARASRAHDSLNASWLGVRLGLVAFGALLLWPASVVRFGWLRTTFSVLLFWIGASLVSSVLAGTLDQLRWDSVRDVNTADTPIRGLFAPVTSPSLTFERLGSEVSPGATAFNLSMLFIVAVLIAVSAWSLIRVALGFEERRWDRLTTTTLRSEARSNWMSVGAIAVGFAIVITVFGSAWSLHHQLADEVPIPDGYMISTTEVRRLSMAYDTDSPVVRVVLRQIEDTSLPAESAMEAALADAGFSKGPVANNTEYSWSRDRVDGYDATFIGFAVQDQDNDGSRSAALITVQAGVFDTDYMMVSLPALIIGLLSIVFGVALWVRKGDNPA